MTYTPQDGFPYYFDLVKDQDYKSLFSSLATFEFLNSINDFKSEYRYAPDKWSIKQIVGHMTDHERIKIYRSFLMSRSVKVELWGYDQNLLVNNSRFEDLTFQELRIDFLNVRKASISFVESLSEAQLKIKGMTGQYEVSLEDFLVSIIGHEQHHMKIIKERYI